MNDVPEFANWIGSLCEKSLYKHLLESLNHVSEETQGESIIELTLEIILVHGQDTLTIILDLSQELFGQTGYYIGNGPIKSSNCYGNVKA